jgi:hypothetical protein
VTGFKVGEAVFGLMPGGGYAEVIFAILYAFSSIITSVNFI